MCAPRPVGGYEVKPFLCWAERRTIGGALRCCGRGRGVENPSHVAHAGGIVCVLDHRSQEDQTRGTFREPRIPSEGENAGAVAAYSGIRTRDANKPCPEEACPFHEASFRFACDDRPELSTTGFTKGMNPESSSLSESSSALSEDRLPEDLSNGRTFCRDGLRVDEASAQTQREAGMRSLVINPQPGTLSCGGGLGPT